jgi:hypothetical protein
MGLVLGLKGEIEIGRGVCLIGSFVDVWFGSEWEMMM